MSLIPDNQQREVSPELSKDGSRFELSPTDWSDCVFDGFAFCFVGVLFRDWDWVMCKMNYYHRQRLFDKKSTFASLINKWMDSVVLQAV